MKHASLTQAFWDYNLTEQELRQKLEHGTKDEQAWIIARMLENLPFETIWKYITLAQLKEFFPRLRMRPKLKQIWTYTLALWDNHEKTTH